MKTLTVFVLKSSGMDCTMNGITSNNNMLTLVMDYTANDVLEMLEREDKDKILLLDKRELWNKQLWYCKPLVEKPNCLSPMMGGNYVVTSDSRFKEFTPHQLGYPLPVHDRFETQEQYDRNFN